MQPLARGFGPSQTGITQQYISRETLSEGGWVSANASTGRSAFWVADYYGRSNRMAKSGAHSLAREPYGYAFFKRLPLRG